MRMTRAGIDSIARCRELLGDEADALTDQEIALIRRHAETMALDRGRDVPGTRSDSE